jgi:hypothetical protein
MKMRLGLVALLLLVAAAVVRADVIDPWAPWSRRHDVRFDPRYYASDPSVPVVVSIDDRATEARLIVPKKHMPSVAALLPNDDTARADARLFRWPVVVIPVAAALAVSGLWLTGLRPRLGARGLAVLLGVIVLGGVGAAIAWGHPPPPPPPPPLLLKGKVTVEVVEEGDTVKLVLPRDMLKELVPNR